MSRIPPIDTATAQGERQSLLAAITRAFGGVTPAMFRITANSPVALASMWGAFGALSRGRLPSKLTELVAVAIADRNGCEYCLAAHSALGHKAGASAQDVSDAQAGRSTDPRTAAALAFALRVVEKRAHIEDADVQALRTAGFDDELIVELVAHVALNLFTNYVNVALGTPVDFPAVRLRSAA